MLWASVKKSVTNPAWIRKAIAALIVCALAAVAKGMVPEVVGQWINIAEPFLAFLGVWFTPNAQDKPGL